MEVAVLGAGNGGCAAAGDLTRRGHRVRLCTRSADTLIPILERGGIELRGAAGEGFVPLAAVTLDLARAIYGAEVVMLAVPSTAHEHYARALAPLLRPEQVVFLNPGHTGGGLHFIQTLRRLGREDVCCGEAATLTYATRLVGPAQVEIYRVTTNLPFASFPGKHRDRLLEVLGVLYPALVPARSVLETALLNLNAVEHPPGMLLNAGWIEHAKGDFYYYYEGTTPAVARLIEAVDRERLALAQALGIPTMSFLELFYRAGYTTEAGYRSGSVYTAMQESAPNRWMKAPASLDHRYLHEDVGCGLVPWCELARLAGVETPVLRLLTDLACLVTGIDYWREGRTLAKLGLENLPLSQLDEFLYEGHR